ncbi:hypothetical protein ACU14_16955 [Xanthomonas oryzae pv. oryzicola]|nr:hypothetical protein ACU14_16955 [Xanthomonas oryzae pv. oryzicola]AKO17150.1 hypothetical protein ACU12_17025 [Xanthomonas oryzae pv. oryzicola]
MVHTTSGDSSVSKMPLPPACHCAKTASTMRLLQAGSGCSTQVPADAVSVDVVPTLPANAAATSSVAAAMAERLVMAARW